VKIHSLLKSVYCSTIGNLFLLANVYFRTLVVVISSSPYHVSGRCKFDSPAKAAMFTTSVWGERALSEFVLFFLLYSTCYMFCENGYSRLD
jgi:hypothetical protein